MADLFPFIVSGIVIGSMYGIIAAGLVLTYQTSGVFNFAHGATAMICAYVYYALTVDVGLPVGIGALIAVFGFAPLLALVLERLLFRRLVGSPTVNKVIGSVGLFVLLTGVAVVLFGSAGKRVPSILPTNAYEVSRDFFVGADQIGVVVIGVCVAAALFALLNLTRLGTAILAVVDRRDLAALGGIDVNRISQITACLGTMLAAVAGILLSPLVILDAQLFSLLVIQAFSAAMFGFLASVPLAFLGGLVVGLGESLMTRYVPATGGLVGLRASFSFLMLFAVLLFYAARNRRPATAAASLLAARRAGPANTRFGRGARSNQGVLGLVAIGVILPFMLSPSWQLTVLVAVPLGITFLSLTVLTGYAGQISLCQASFMGVGAIFAARVADTGLNFWLVLPLSGLVAVPLGLAVGIPALRVSGLHLALLTLGLGLLIDSMVMNNLSITGGGAGLSIDRPSLPGLDLTDDRTFYFVLLMVLLATAWVVANLRRSRTGRILRAIRDSEAGARTLGIDPRRYKLVAFGISAFLAGVAGALFAAVRTQISSLDFGLFQSLLFLVVVVVAGVRSPVGAVLGAAIYACGPKLFGDYLPPPLDAALPAVLGLGAAFGLLRFEDGIVGFVREAGERLRNGPPPRSRPAPTVHPIPRVVEGGDRPPPLAAIRGGAGRTRPVRSRA